MVNKVAALGALVCVVAAGLSTALLLTDEFVEVFVALGNGETSCAIGFLGVNEAGFDASCLTAEQLEQSSLGGVDPNGNKVFSIEAFTAPTEEFKLLFPTQQAFYYEINPLYTRLIDCLAAEVPPFACSEGQLAGFPSFESLNEDCDTFYSTVATLHATPVSGVFAQGQPQINALVANLFTVLPVEAVVGAVYDNSLFFGLIQVFGQFVEGGTNQTFSDLSNAAAILTLNGFATNAALSSDSTTLMAGRLAAKAAVVAGALTTCNFTTIEQCLGAGFGLDFPDVTGVNYVTEDYGVEFCEVVLNTAATCQFSALASAILPALQVVFTAQQTETLGLLIGGWNGALQVGLLHGTGNVTVTGDGGGQEFKTVLTTPQVGSTEFLAATNASEFAVATFTAIFTETNSFTYPSTIDANFGPCSFLQSLGLYGPQIQQSTCTFQFFIEKAADVAAASEDASAIGLAVSLSTLFGTCFDVIEKGLFTDPNDCWKFFPAALLNLAFSGSLEDAFLSFNVTAPRPGIEVFNAAADSCNDDVKDLEAIGSAQAISPVGIVFLGAAAVFAVVSVAVNNKVIAGVAGGVSLLGTLLILIALITVYNAPIYSSVGSGDDATPGEIVYLSGRTVSFGLGAIALGAIGGVIMIVSVFTFSASGSAEAKALGAATEKPVSI